MVIALADRTLPSVILGLDRVLRAIGGAPTYVLTDNERTVTIDHVCGIAVRNPRIVAAARHYGFVIQTCVPADPQSKGGSEATVRIAKADLVPTDHNLRADYASFAELEDACRVFCARVNGRVHRVTQRTPELMLAQELGRLHPLPALAHTLCFGETRKVSEQSTISIGSALYSVPSSLVEQKVWARADGDELIVIHVGPGRAARGRAPPADDAGAPEHPGRALPAQTTRRPGTRPARAERGRGRVPADRAGRERVADAGRGGRRGARPAQDGRSRRSRQAPRPRSRRGGAEGRRRRRPL